MGDQVWSSFPFAIEPGGEVVPGGGGGDVTSVFGRTGDVVAETGDYSSSEIAEAPLTWHAIVSFSNGWVNFGSGEAAAAYAIDNQGLVHLRGLIKSGTVGFVTAFTVPAAAFPAFNQRFVTSSGTSFASIQCVTPATGAFEVFEGSNAGVALDGIVYPLN